LSGDILCAAGAFLSAAPPGVEVIVKHPMLIVLSLCAVGALVRAGFRFSHKEWFPAACTAVIGLSAIVMIVVLLRALSQLDLPLEDADSSGGRIVMQVSGAVLGDSLYWAVGFFLSAIGLMECPDALWTRWLSYPAAFVALLLMGVMLLVTMGQKLQRVEADSGGMRVLTETRGLPPVVIPSVDTSDLTEPETVVAWRQVGAVKRIEVRVRRGDRQGGGSVVLRHEFVLLDREGRELLNVEEPLDPPDRYQRFLEAIPRWTGLQVESTSVTK
jgi:hypothetical protein